MLSLYFKGERVGEIDNSAHDENAWFSGEIRLNDAGEHFRPFFRWATSEEPDPSEEALYSDELFEDGTWWLVTEDGRRVDIYVPAIHEDGAVYWRAL
jgi:hypothetical protein